MNHIIVGTAGHIDHGKTSLIKALTGNNTDRWEEEKRRGITIDLGFTYFDLPSGNRVGIIDVPGHEKFVNNMTAGVVGMDVVLLVIAADEGIMPQTREHMDILHLLGIKKCIVVLNKCDLVDEEWLELVTEETREELSGSFLENAPIIPLSSKTGQGIETLIQTLDEMTVEEEQEKEMGTIPRLPIDRVFSLSGFGTVVTGTLISGKIKKEDKLEMYPLNKECKIRSIQVHGEDVPVCYAGQRVAINLSNVKKSELKRGNVLAVPNSMRNTDLLDVKMEILPSSLRILTNGMRLHLYTGTTEVLCRAILLDKENIGPKEEGYVQLRLDEEIALRKGDPFIVRFYSPMETIGGGVVLDPNPKIKKRFREEVIEELRQKEKGSSKDVTLLRIKEHKAEMINTVTLAKLSARSLEEIEKDIEELQREDEIVVFETRKEKYVWPKEAYIHALENLQKLLKEYEEKHPYRFGFSKAQSYTSMFKGLKQAAFDQFIEKAVEDGEMERRGEFIHTVGFAPKKDDVYEGVRKKVLSDFKKAGYDFLRYKELELPVSDIEKRDDIFNLLLEEKEVVKVSEDMYTLKTLMDQGTEMVKKELAKNPVITISQVRDMFHTSRKSAKPILEYMDSIKVTKKTGGESERTIYHES
ncbi:selenocysteine-specific elongation factor SelB [Aequitasia blattaphilus]|uniref:Selenocysteine-specific elongation factor n=1 Tax=Aequitasia blattaphilus TaxID=2949332 RepID=A0ABT1EAP9_9FIRM|nr:selenocysteine-specific translation elongation factor [Aequitasia blattaphilus]MCP1102888.1 selenocysteine-specific translation elongation factor [Aequitasia blattaphilus]MCR8615528.1 selenocysteine-specific translation elongation factor [Aequitasia blattaphilus]